MTYPYGPKGSGDIRRANPLPRGMSSFPVVGKGLGGLPVRVEGPAFPPPEAIVFYTNSANRLDVFDANFKRVTSTYVTTQPTVSADGSMEQMWKPPRQRKYMGMGSFARSPATAGAVIDISVTPWVVHENYTAIGTDGSGNAIIRNMAPGPAGFVAGFSQDSAGDEAVCNITTKAEVTGQPSLFTATSGAGTMKVYGNYLYQMRNNGTTRFLFTGGTLSLAGSNSTPNSSNSSDCSIAASPDDSVVYALRVDTLHTLTPAIDTAAPSILLTSYGFERGEAIETSPDGKWLLICGVNTSGSDGRVLVMNTETRDITVMSVPTGSTNARFVGCAWYPDSDQYIVSGYIGARTHYGKRTAGGSLKNLYTDLFSSTGSTFGVAIIEKAT